MSKLQQDFTQGNIAEHLVKFSLPFLLSNLLQALYSVADMLIVGMFCSTEALAGVNMGGQVTNLVVMLVSGLTVGGTVLVAQYFGAHKEQDVKETIGTLFSLLALLGVALSLIMLYFSEPVLRLLQTPEEAVEPAKEYLNICLLGTIFVFGYNAISSIQRGLGDSRRPLYFVAVACVINVGLDLLLVGPFEMGPAGAAWATIAAQGISMILAAVFLAKNKFIFDFKLKSFAIKKDKMRLLFQLGLPNSIQSVTSNLSFLLMTALVNGFGLAATAAAGVASKFNSFAILPALAMSASVSSIAAQNIGADQFDRARQSLGMGVKIAMVLSIIVFALVQLFPQAILSLFSNDPEVIACGVSYLRAFSFDYLVVPTVFCINGLVNGSGHTTFSLINGMLSSIILRMPVAYLLSMTPLGLTGIGLAAPMASLGSLALGMWFYKSGRWLKNTTGISRSLEA